VLWKNQTSRFTFTVQRVLLKVPPELRRFLLHSSDNLSHFGTNEFIAARVSCEYIESWGGPERYSSYRRMVPMIRTCLAVSFTLVVFLIDIPALAQNHFVGSGFTFFPPPMPPAALSWRLATQTGEFVELVVPPVQHSSNQIVHLVTPDNATEFSLNFADWAAAVNSPAYNRSIVSFGGAIKEQPWSNPWSGDFELERIQLLVNSFDGISNSAAVQGGVLDFIPVPEPTTWLMACSIGLHLFGRRKSRQC
jgi:hypothetical protein